MSEDYWASDVRVSMPQPLADPSEVTVGSGWAFTQSGLTPDMTTERAKALATPTFAPVNVVETVYEDEYGPQVPASDVKVF